MKISKVDHTKAAIGKEKDQIHGILYTDPKDRNRRNGSKKIETVFEARNRTAQKLFNLFNQPDEKNKEDREPVQILNNFYGNIFFKQIGREKSVRSLEDVFSQMSHVRIGRYDEKTVENCLVLYLRKSLQSEKDTLKVIYDKINNIDNISEDEWEAISRFRNVLEESYMKTKQGQRIVKSIKNQNMLVQPKREGDRTVMALSGNREGKSRQKEKEGFARFLQQYADLDEQSRMNSLRILRRILDLYFYLSEENLERGVLPEEVNASDSLNVWHDHESKKSSSQNFVDPGDIPEKPDNREKPDGMKDPKIRKKANKDYELKCRLWKSDLEERIRRKNISCYRLSVQAIDVFGEDIFFKDRKISCFWIHHIENAVERILKSMNPGKIFKLNVGYLSEKIWKDMLNYISIKYIALGKAVYNYAMEDLLSNPEDSHALGKVLPNFDDGLTSFDYEQIKAEETLQRELAVAVSFAANNLARATVKPSDSRDKEDFLTWKEDTIRQQLIYGADKKGGTLRAILQFFGGISTWDKKWIEGVDETGLLCDFQQIIYSLRNESFHFKTEVKNGQSWDAERIGEMFGKEANACISIERDKFYSNNLPMFYTDRNLELLLNHLYGKCHSRASQVPAFGSVCVRSHFPDYLRTQFKVNPTMKDEDKSKWYSAVYYAFKEIYYNSFLTVENKNLARQLFMNALNDLEKSNNDNPYAVKDFSGRCRELKNLELSRLCQIIMTEFNQQNAGNRKIKSSFDTKRNPDKFQHYKMLLLKVLGNAFAAYIRQKSELKFLYTDILSKAEYEIKPKEEFLPEWKSQMYESLIKAVKQDRELQKWYILGKFLNGKMLNLLAGSLRSYLQFTGDVRRRAQETGNQLRRENKRSEIRIEKAVEVLDFCIRLSSRFSNNHTDYFADEEEYAEYLSNYLAFDESDRISYRAKLDSFCNLHEEKLPGTQTGLMIYMDGANPIPNRNIIMSRLFGPTEILRHVVSPITREDVGKYYEAQKKISGYRAKGQCENKEEQKELLNYQRLVNRIEFRFIVEYGELINDLLGQLINWCYLRERDLMYFQIGFHYMCLQNGQCRKPDGYEKITLENGNTVENVILQQIVALYVNGINMYTIKGEKAGFDEGVRSAGGKIKAFLNYYSKMILEDSQLQCAFSERKTDILYNAGLEVFENINEHDGIIAFRNSIEHNKYYRGKTGSILDMYSEVFDRFFTYDMRYQKNVMNMLGNILKRYFILLKPEFVTKERGAGGKLRAHIGIAPAGISSDRMTYKCKDGNLVIDARDNEYKETVVKILCYPEIPGECNAFISNTGKTGSEKRETRDVESEQNRAKDVGSGKRGEGGYKKAKGVSKKKRADDRLTSSLGDILKDIKLK